jgi:hypothetical protein
MSDLRSTSDAHTGLMLMPFGNSSMRSGDGSRHAISLREPLIGEPENRRFDSRPCRRRGGQGGCGIRALKSSAPANAIARAVAARPPRLLASRRFSCVVAARLHGSLRETASREPAVHRRRLGRRPSRACGRGPLDLACARGRRQPRPDAIRAPRRRFAPGARRTRLPNRLLADVRITPGGGHFVSTGAAGRGCHASRPQTATAGSRGPSFRCRLQRPLCPDRRISERH